MRNYTSRLNFALPTIWASSFIRKTNFVFSSKQQISTAYNRARRHASCQLQAWNLESVRESRRQKVAPWRPNNLTLSLLFAVKMLVSD